jgi:hypothetical protein
MLKGVITGATLRPACVAGIAQMAEPWFVGAARCTARTDRACLRAGPVRGNQPTLLVVGDQSVVIWRWVCEDSIGHGGDARHLR